MILNMKKNKIESSLNFKKFKQGLEKRKSKNLKISINNFLN